MSTRKQPFSSKTAASELRLEIAYRPIGELTPNPRNARQHDARQIGKLAASISTFGFVVPVLVDKKDEIIAGHASMDAARTLQMAAVPTICLEHLTEKQARALAIAHNRLAELSTWDDTLLAAELKALSDMDLDFSIEVIGFDVPEIDLRIQVLDDRGAVESDPADELPPPASETVSRSGDLWLLGPHRVLCGDALDATSYKALMDGEQAAMAFADPPYNVPIDGHASGNGHIRHREFLMASGEMTAQEFTAFLTESLELISTNSKPGALAYLCMDWRHMRELQAACDASRLALLNLCVWVKTNGGMGTFYRSQHELIFVCRNGQAPHRNNVQLGRFGRNRTNVWTYPGANSFGRAGEEGKLLALHPTVKPTALVADAILDCTARGDLVLDPFLGSGTTVMAGERTGRRCFGLELDPAYVDTIVARWERFTRSEARHASGKTFAEVASKRRAP